MGSRIDALADALAPERVRVSPKFRAILGCMLRREWTNPVIAELVVTSDGFLLGRHAGDCGFNAFLGDYSDLLRNVEGLAECVGLPPAQHTLLRTLTPDPPEDPEAFESD